MSLSYNTMENNDTGVTDKMIPEPTSSKVESSITANDSKNKKYIGIGILIVIIILVVIDVVARPCTLVETESARVSRLKKANLPLIIDNGTLNCVSNAENPAFKLVENNHCESKYSCTGVLLTDFVNWVALNMVLGIFLYLFIYAFCTVAFIPGSILTIGAGIAFTAATNDIGLGIFIGTATVFFGATLGATLSFFMGRYLLKDLTGKLRKKFDVVRAIDKAIEKEGFKTMFLLRLSPLIPFNALNYIMSGTSISLKDYVLACVGMLPATVVYVYVGVSIHVAATGNYKGDTDTSVITLVLFIVGAICGILAIVRISMVAKSYLSNVVNEKEVGDGNVEGEETSKIPL